MNDDMPWVDLTPEEIQELRTKKQELTEYGKQKIRELMNDGKLRFYDKGKETLTIDGSSWGKVQTPEMKLEVKEMTHEEMLEEAARREAIVAKVSEEDYQKVFEEYRKQNKKPTLYEKLEEWVDYGNFAQSRDVLVNEIVNIVKDWLPPEHDSNDYRWNKCIKMMKEKLR